MAFVQMQRVHRYADGRELVIDYFNVEVSTHREYEDLLSPLEAACADNEFTRTVTEGAPLCVRAYVTYAEAEQ